MQYESVWKVDVSSLYKLFTLYESIAGGECIERFVYSQASSQAVKERERESYSYRPAVRVYIPYIMMETYETLYTHMLKKFTQIHKVFWKYSV